MDKQAALNGLVMYMCFIPIVTFHEFAHAWVAWKLGDDTAYRQGRVTLNPTSHIDPIGTILVPLVAVVLMASSSSLAGFIIGWGRSVPVNLLNLQNRARDHSLIALAGPTMNLVLAFVCLLLLRIFMNLDSDALSESLLMVAFLSIFLCWFNMLPIPPLDGSHVTKPDRHARGDLHEDLSVWVHHPDSGDSDSRRAPIPACNDRPDIVRYGFHSGNPIAGRRMNGWFI